MEVDIEPLDEEQARETLKRRLQRKQKKSGPGGGGELVLEQLVEADILPGEEHFYRLDGWDHAAALEIELDGGDVADDGSGDVDLFVITDRQHHRPRLDEHVWGDLNSGFPKHIRLAPADSELAGATALHIGVRGWKEPRQEGDEAAPALAPAAEDGHARFRYTLLVSQVALSAPPPAPMADDSAPGPDHARCPNCTHWIPARTLVLHESFCRRHNVLCARCSAVLRRGAEHHHWHCAVCNALGDSAASHRKHLSTTHTPHACPGCTVHRAASLAALAAHRVSHCPAKRIVCAFCRLLVPQDGDPAHPDAEQILSGLTHHELACGARTTECPRCARRTRLRDLPVHLRHHELQRLAAPLPSICANALCCRSVATSGSGGSASVNALGLCDVCFGPLYSSSYDPTGSQLRSRVERRLLRQLLAGCGKHWCRGELCRTGRGGRERMATKDALPLVHAARARGALSFCVGEATAQRRALAERLAVETALDHGKGAYAIEFCVRAVEVTGGDEGVARSWLEREGVRIGER